MAHFDPLSTISEKEMNLRPGVTEEDSADFYEADIKNPFLHGNGMKPGGKSHIYQKILLVKD